MFPNVNPAQMKAMMKQMGIRQDEIEAERVIIETADKKIIIEPASVQKITMQGQTSWQIAGEVREESREQGISEDDISLVMEKTGASKHHVHEMLLQTKGDIAEAILNLSK